MGKAKRKFADDGWALWIDGDDRSTFYLNEWINPKGKSYVDVSVRIYGAKNVHSVNIFVPFTIEKSEISDLSHMLSEEMALRALFNTNAKIDTEKNKYTSELHYDKRIVSLINLYKEYIDVKNISHGSVITIDFNYIIDYVTSDEAYLIFRIPHKTLDAVFTSTINVDGVYERIKSLIQSPIISEKYGYSIRINEARLLPEEINKIEVLHQQRIRKTLVTISIADDYELNDSTCYRIRRLEAELNRNYAPDDYDCHNAITYQWVEERTSNMKAHYNFYFTMQMSKISKISMIIYLLILFICSALGSALYDLAKFIFSIF